jgi:hypothetical protein
MTRESPTSASPSTCLVQVRQAPDGPFTAQIVGGADLQATGATREEAVERLRALLQEQVNLGSLLSIEIPRQDPVMSRFGWAKDDPTFDEYLEEIRKFREEMDRREAQDTEQGECSDISLRVCSINI